MAFQWSQTLSAAVAAQIASPSADHWVYVHPAGRDVQLGPTYAPTIASSLYLIPTGNSDTFGHVGTANGQRIGNQIHISSIQIKMCFQVDPNDTSLDACAWRFVLVEDRANNLATTGITGAQLFDQSPVWTAANSYSAAGPINGNAFRNPYDRKYHILKDWVASPLTGTVTREACAEFNVVTNHTLIFSGDSTPNTLANLRGPNVCMLAAPMMSMVTSTTFPTTHVVMNVRINYTDS